MKSLCKYCDFYSRPLISSAALLFCVNVTSVTKFLPNPPSVLSPLPESLLLTGALLLFLNDYQGAAPPPRGCRSGVPALLSSISSLCWESKTLRLPKMNGSRFKGT